MQTSAFTSTGTLRVEATLRWTIEFRARAAINAAEAGDKVTALAKLNDAKVYAAQIAEGADSYYHENAQAWIDAATGAIKIHLGMVA